MGTRTYSRRRADGTRVMTRMGREREQMRAQAQSGQTAEERGNEVIRDMLRQEGLLSEQPAIQVNRPGADINNISRQASRIASNVSKLRGSDMIPNNGWRSGGRADTPAELVAGRDTRPAFRNEQLYIRDVTVNELDTRVQTAYNEIAGAVADLIPVLRAQNTSREAQAYYNQLETQVSNLRQLLSNPKAFVATVYETGGRIKPVASPAQQAMLNLRRALANPSVTIGEGRGATPAKVVKTVRDTIESLQKKENFELGQVALGQSRSKRLSQPPYEVATAQSYTL